MKVIILAAGQGTRLRPLTDEQPKCMVKFRGKPIIDYIIETVKKSGINDIVVVDGYKKSVLEQHLAGQNIKFYTNESYESTNMVYTLFSALPELNADIIISYADIIYETGVIQKLIDDESDFSVVVDKKWRELWSARMDDPLKDAETMKINEDGFIYELGKKPKCYDDIHGQYIGLIKINKSFVKTFIEYYKSLDRKSIYDGKNFNNMYMTSLIQSISDNVKKPKAVFIEGGWIEIDSIEDLNAYESADISTLRI
ncbi:MAG: phosphocholine cytidylyltransferase family protein [Spirochaetaceae bacterium]|jgi:choline kinase|nr:phosphocholine cytidylyltransferase family protein [Spirochaetaceae bacterium]